MRFALWVNAERDGKANCFWLRARFKPLAFFLCRMDITAALLTVIGDMVLFAKQRLPLYCFPEAPEPVCIIHTSCP
jgi:hypothetical protein